MKKNYLIGLLLFLAVCGCSTMDTAVMPDNRVVLMDLCRNYGFSCQADDVTQVITIAKGDIRAKALVESNIVVYGKEDIVLMAPVVKIKGVVYVTSDFKEKVIDRMQSIEAVKDIVKRPVLARPYQVIIDAGHGGKDPGAIGRSGSQEKWIVLDISNKLNAILKQRGFKTVMTRTNDTFLSLVERTEIASRSNADLFVSIHANSNPRRNVNGVEVYTLRRLTSEEEAEEQRIKNRRMAFSKFDMKRNNANLDRILSDMMAESKEKESKILASYLAKEISQRTRVKNLGVKEAGFFVLRNTITPAVLVEVGYLSNHREEKLLKNSSHRQLVAEAIAAGISQYFD